MAKYLSTLGRHMEKPSGGSGRMYTPFDLVLLTGITISFWRYILLITTFGLLLSLAFVGEARPLDKFLKIGTMGCIVITPVS